MARSINSAAVSLEVCSHIAQIRASTWIERVSPEAMALACLESETLPPLTMFKILRTQMDELGFEPDHRIHSLAELPALVSA